MAAVLFWVAVWLVAACTVDNDLLLASPVDVAASLAANFASALFWATVAASGARIAATSVACAALGTVLGLMAVRFRLVDRLCAPLVLVMKSAPVACVAVILLVMLGPAGAVVVVVAFVSLPPFFVAATEAARARPRDAERVLALMGVTPARVFLACTWPACVPFFKAAAKTAVATSWRAGVTAELLGVPLGSIGSAVYVSKLMLDAAGLLAWTIVVMACGWACEKLAVALVGLTEKSRRLALRGKKGGEGEKPAAPASRRAPISLSDIDKSYGESAVLDGVSLHVSPGQRVCLMAPTGSGKTTLLRMALGLEHPDAGSVERPSRVGVVLQAPTLVENLTAWENVLVVAGAPSNAARAQLEALLPPGCADKPACDLSGGTRRLTEVARAVFSPGEAVVLDEPFAGLDEQTRLRACAFVLDHLNGRALVVATHESQDACALDARTVALG